MKILISNTSDTPLYQQIKDQITDAILKGELKEGDPLPSIRSFANDLRVSVLTIRRVYDDLRHLGAPDRYLFRSVKGQVSKVFLVPAIVGTAVISAFYLMIMYFNDNRFTPGEFAGMAACAAVIAAVSVVLYLVYRITRRSVCRTLGIRRR